MTKDLGTLSKALEMNDQALEIFTTLVGQHPDDPEHRFHLGASYNHRGLYLLDLGKTAEAAAAFQQALPILEALQDKHREVAKYQDQLARSYNHLGIRLVLSS